MSSDGDRIEIYDEAIQQNLVDEDAIEEGEDTKNLEKKSRKLRIAFIIFGSVFMLYGVVLLGGYFIQNIFVFDPQRSNTLKTPDLKVFGPNLSETETVLNEISGWRVVELVTSDKVTLHNYWIRANEQLKEEVDQVPDTILFLHGKDGRIDRRLTMISNIYTKRYCNIFMLSYRGYGKSTGSPSEIGIKTDAQAALDWILGNVSDREKKRIFVYGQSLGGAVSINLVARNNENVCGLIIENTFLSITRLMPDLSVFLYAFIPIMNQNFASDLEIINITKPILFLSGSADTFIPPAHMTELFEIVSKKNPNCKLVKFPDGGHSDTSRKSGYFEAIVDFIKNSPCV